MTPNARQLSERLRAFNNEVRTFVQNCSTADWQKVCEWEQWPVGVVARHIAAGHYGAVELVKMIVNKQPLPELTAAKITEMANRHAREHADCTPEEVLSLIQTNGTTLIDYIDGLQDEELARSGYLALLDQPVSAGKLVEMVILESGQEHLDHMRNAVSG